MYSDSSKVLEQRGPIGSQQELLHQNWIISQEQPLYQNTLCSTLNQLMTYANNTEITLESQNSVILEEPLPLNSCKMASRCRIEQETNWVLPPFEVEKKDHFGRTRVPWQSKKIILLFKIKYL